MRNENEHLVNFQHRLISMVSKHAVGADEQRYAEIMEALAKALGFTVALAAHGDGKTIDILMTGIEAYAHQEAVEKARAAELMGMINK